MLKTVVLLNIFEETVLHFIQDSLIIRKFKRTVFIFLYKCIDQRLEFMNRCIYFRKKKESDPKLLNSRVTTVIKKYVYFQHFESSH